jgi:hypothetical protein
MLLEIPFPIVHYAIKQNRADLFGAFFLELPARRLSPFPVPAAFNDPASGKTKRPGIQGPGLVVDRFPTS